MAGKFRGVRRTCAWVDHAVQALVVMLFAAMVVVGAWQVISRKVLGASLTWSEELQIYMHIWLVFLAVGVAYRHSKHIAVTFIVERFPLFVQRGMAVFYDVAWLVLGVSMVYFSSVYQTPLGRTFLETAAKNRSPSLRLPGAAEGVPYSLIYAGLVVGGVYIVFVAVRRLVARALGLETEEAAATEFSNVPGDA